ncbi:MAG: PAS domain-containing protein [Rhodospirillaceae bacterium]|jgi:PAS domain-containing protein|nr:PAS domain-containing protein [Rhodospirillaceae bacterium]
MTSEFGIRAAAELFAASPMGVSVITADGTERLFANQEFATLFGFSDLEEALQFPIESTFVDIDDLARARTFGAQAR